MPTVRENSFLADWLPRLASDENLVIPPGDDCAAIRQSDGELLLVAVDQVAVDHHYLASDDARLVGRKLLARNLSDIAAMGGTPTYALVTLALPGETAAARADELMRGIAEFAKTHAVIIAGGDLGAADSEVASITIMGRVAADKVVRRSGAAAGDLLFVTGKLGDSFASGRHLTFEPRLAVGQFLAEQGFARVMIDLSDGLVMDLQRLCEANDLDAELSLTQLPLHEGASIEAACYDGEDYELLFAIAADRAAELEAAWPFATPLTRIGRFLNEPPRHKPIPLQRVFDHFAVAENAESATASRIFADD